MGYYTKFDLSILNDNNYLLDEILDNNEDLQYYLNEKCKWYERRHDMIKISLNHKDKIFRLEGKGEEDDDLWVEFYKNGEYRYFKSKIVIIHKEYDEDIWN